jgi:hypothetical protein
VYYSSFVQSIAQSSVTDAIQSLTTPEFLWHQWARLAHTFPRYSALNRSLIYAQNPSATWVTSPRT